MRVLKRLFGIILCLFCLQMCYISVDARELQVQTARSERIFNPLYPNADVEQTESNQVYGPQKLYSSDTIFYSIEEAGVFLREAMVNRETNITFSVKDCVGSFNYHEAQFQAVFEQAYLHTGNPKEGDSLKWVWQEYTYWVSYSYDTNRNGIFTYQIELIYYTTTWQEEELESEIDWLMSSGNVLDFSGVTSEYSKVKKIYDYICTNITYDYATLDDDTYKLKYTAYAALIDKTAVCQGYAVLFYKFALEAGVDARLISGDGGGPHAWNIVRLGDYYYNLDSTWDAGCYDNYNYFLKCEDTFYGHTRDWEYNTEEFHQEYPMGRMDYSEGQIDMPPSIEYDVESHIGESFKLGVYSTSNQDFTISCNADIPFEYYLTESSSVVTGSQSYYIKKYRVIPDCNVTGSYVFTLTGSRGVSLDYYVLITDHVYSSNVVYPTCTERGYNYHQCQICYEGYKDSYVDALGHDEYVIGGWDATCTEDGLTDQVKCRRCEQVILAPKVIPAYGHTCIEVIEKATLEKDGIKESYCDTCGETIESKQVIAHPDKFILSKEVFFYNGTIQFPEIQIFDVDGKLIDATYYDLIYSNQGSAAVGTYMVTVNLKGLYEGSKTFTYVIESSLTKLSSISNSASGVTVKWEKVKDADYYRVYRKTGSGSWAKVVDTKDGNVTSYTDTTAKAGTTYTYTVKAFREKKGGEYDKTGLSICRLTQPKLTSAANGASGVVVKWGKVTGATGYYVYRKTETGSWGKIGTITSNGTVSYTDKTAKAGTTYIYTVRAYKGKVLSSYDTKGVSTCRLAQPKLTSAANSSSGVVVKWSKVTGATGYYVYRKTGSGSWGKIGTITSNGTVSYTDKTAKAGTTYTYTVRAYKGKVLSSYDTNGVSMKRLSQPAVPKLKKVSNGIQITFTKVTGANGYYVYRKEGKGSWTRIASTTSLTVVDKTAKKGHTYQYTVKAWSKVGKTTVYSSYHTTGSKMTR